MCSASCRRSRTSPSRRPCAWWHRRSVSRCPSRRTPLKAKRGGQAPRCAGRPARARLWVLRGTVAASRRRPGARVPHRAWTYGGSDHDLPHRLRAGFGLHLARPPEGRGRRRDVESIRPFLVERSRRGEERANDQRSTTNDDLLQVPQPGDVAHYQRIRQSDRLHRTDAGDRRQSRTEVPEFAEKKTAIYSKSRVLYNLDRAHEAIRALGYVVLVEGQMDCISVFMAGSAT